MGSNLANADTSSPFRAVRLRLGAFELQRRPDDFPCRAGCGCEVEWADRRRSNAAEVRRGRQAGPYSAGHAHHVRDSSRRPLRHSIEGYRERVAQGVHRPALVSGEGKLSRGREVRSVSTAEDDHHSEHSGRDRAGHEPRIPLLAATRWMASSYASIRWWKTISFSSSFTISPAAKGPIRPGDSFIPIFPRTAETVMDFNKAQNPPCAFTSYATCPLPPKQNRLPVRIEAGELNYGHHWRSRQLSGEYVILGSVKSESFDPGLTTQV